MSKCSDPSKRIWLRTGKDNTSPNKHLYNKMASSHTFHFVLAWWHHKYSDFRKSHQGKPRKGQVTEASFKHLIIQGLHGNAWKFNPRFRQFSFFKMKIIQVTNVKNRPIVCVLIQKRIPDELKEGSLLPYQRALSVFLTTPPGRILGCLLQGGLEHSINKLSKVYTKIPALENFRGITQ